jgi:hypothetical protein
VPNPSPTVAPPTHSGESLTHRHAEIIPRRPGCVEYPD